jgi:hypothetical protein
VSIFKRRRAKSAHGPISAADALFTPVQQRILGILFGNPERRFTASDVTTLSDLNARAVRRELDRLEAGQLVLVRRVTGEQHYQANAHAPLFHELTALVKKSFGLIDVMRVVLASEAGNVRAAFLFGSGLSHLDDASGHVELLAISDATAHGEFFHALDESASVTGRAIKATIYSSREFARRLRDKNQALAKVLVQPRVWIVGGRSLLTR